MPRTFRLRLVDCALMWGAAGFHFVAEAHDASCDYSDELFSAFDLGCFVSHSAHCPPMISVYLDVNLSLNMFAVQFKAFFPKFVRT